MTDSTVKLTVPLEVEGKIISEITIRRPKVKDLRAIEKARPTDGGDLEQGIVMAATLSGLPLSAMDEMDAGDFAAISEAISGLMDRTAGRGQ